jgi:hypothetical protein
MKTITQYREDIKNLMKKSADIDSKATNENRELSEAELSLKNEILDEVEVINKSVATLERQERMAKLLESPEPAKTVEAKIPAMSLHRRTRTNSLASASS